MAHRNAASVLPEPVGAMTSVLSPSAMADHASACAAVGAAKVPVNHSRVSALNALDAAVGGHLAIVPTSTDKYQRCSGATASPRADGMPGTRPIASSKACAQASATYPASIDGSIRRCLHISNVKASQP